MAITATYDLFKLKMLPELRIVFEELLQIGRWWAGAKIIELKDPVTQKFYATKSDDPMWGRVILRSAQSSGGLESATALAAWMDECGQDAFTVEDWEAVQRRLALTQGPVLGTTTPYNVGWLKRDVYDRWKAGDPTFNVIQFPSILNPAFPPEEFERLRRTMQTWRFQMFFEGLLVQPAGLIYDCFTEEMVVRPFPVPPHWRRVIGLDFGGANQAAVYLAREPATGAWYAYAESLTGQKTTREYALGVIKALEGCPTRQVYGGASSEGQQRRDWAAAGVWVEEPTVKEVEPGIDRITEVIKLGLFRVFDSCRGLLDELGSYRRKLDDAGDPTDLIVDKRAYHILDALRYAGTGLRRRIGFG